MNIQPFCTINILQIRLDPARYSYSPSEEQGLHYPLKIDYEL